jgi:hypothetical protein
MLVVGHERQFDLTLCICLGSLRLQRESLAAGSSKDVQVGRHVALRLN